MPEFSEAKPKYVGPGTHSFVMRVTVLTQISGSHSKLKVEIAFFLSTR